MKLTKEIMVKLVNKMVKIVRADTGGSAVYRDMLLSMLPNSSHKVNISYWNYKADRHDFDIMLKLMLASNTDIIFTYESIVLPYKEELLNFKCSE